MSTKDNLLTFIKKKNISKTEFYKITGLSNGFLDKGGSVTSSNLETILTFFPELSLDWLITGNGPMLRNNVSQSIDGNHNIQANGDVKIDESTLKLKEKISYLENQVCFLTEQVKEKDNQINTLLSIMSNK